MIAELLTDPQRAERLPTLTSIAFRQYQHRLPLGGCMLGTTVEGRSSFRVVYALHYLPADVPNAKCAIAFKVQAAVDDVPTHARQPVLTAICDSHEVVNPRSVRLGTIEPSAWDLSVAEWAAFCEQTVFKDSMGQLCEFAGLKGGERVLDLAAGTGALAEELLSRHPGLQVTVLESSPQMLLAAKAKLKRFSTRVSYTPAAGVSSPPAAAGLERFSPVVSYALCHAPPRLAEPEEDVDVRRQQFDVILMHLALPALASSTEELKQLAAWCARYLDRGGRVLLCAHNGAVEIPEADYVPPKRDRLRRKLQELAKKFDASREVRTSPRIDPKCVYDAFTKCGFTGPEEPMVRRLGEMDRWALWRIPAVLNSVLDARKLWVRDRTGLHCLIDEAMRAVGHPTAHRTVAFWSFEYRPEARM